MSEGADTALRRMYLSASVTWGDMWCLAFMQGLVKIAYLYGSDMHKVACITIKESVSCYWFCHSLEATAQTLLCGYDLL